VTTVPLKSGMYSSTRKECVMDLSAESRPILQYTLLTSTVAGPDSSAQL
jgi:hypothetical protein